MLPALLAVVEQEVGSALPEQQAAVTRRLREPLPAGMHLFAGPAVEILHNPWAGLRDLEAHALGLIDPVVTGEPGALLARMSRQIGDGAVTQAAPAVPLTSSDPLDEIVATLGEAVRLRDQALAGLNDEERAFLFEHAARLVTEFVPQITDESPASRPRTQADMRFYRLAAQIDLPALSGAVDVLFRLSTQSWLERVRHYVQAINPLTPSAGISGDVRVIRSTPYGLVVIGGPGATRYDLPGGAALIIDLGGDDEYRGWLAASIDIYHSVAAIIDVAGDDRYEGRPLALATGRLGIGLLIDLEGDDRYHLEPGSGGAGFAGVGMLIDQAGDDRYVGTKLTQGAALAGLGALIEHAGRDEYRAFGYSLGFGGPGGSGLLLDVAGDDQYHCGAHYPSNYNAHDAPLAQPGDPAFQYEAFCLGVGSGSRYMANTGVSPGLSLAGGVGMVIDVTGNDRYESGNFSQGVGYFFGVGLKLDGAGRDLHAAARYGHGSAAHGGVGLMLDYEGHDEYTSTGPVYNGGTAWDRSVAALIDAGRGHDTYALERSDGLGRADHRGWGFFLDDGGDDRYVIRRGLGRVTNESLSGFLDLDGEDRYDISAETGGRGNGVRLVDPAGALFLDR